MAVTWSTPSFRPRPCPLLPTDRLKEWKELLDLESATAQFFQLLSPHPEPLVSKERAACGSRARESRTEVLQGRCQGPAFWSQWSPHAVSLHGGGGGGSQSQVSAQPLDLQPHLLPSQEDSDVQCGNVGGTQTSTPESKYSETHFMKK